MSRQDDAIKDAQFGDGAEWSAITGKPTEFPPEAHTHPLSNLDSTGATAGQVARFDGSNVVWGTVQWSNVGSKPTEFAPSAHNHAVSDLSQSGATTGQLLQWNGTAWVPATIATGGKEVITLIKTARQTITSNTTLQNDNHFTGSLKSLKTYLVEGELLLNAQASGGFKFVFWDGSANDGIFQFESSVYNGQANLALGSTNPNSSVQHLVSSSFVKISGYVSTSSNMGNPTNFTCKWAQHTSNAIGTYLEKGSWMKFTEQ